MHFAAVTALAAATAVLATPIETQAKTVLPLRKVHHVKSAKGLVNSGQSKLRNINGETTPKGKADASSGPITNEVVSYIASVTVGANNYNLIVDTGSSNTWVGAGKKYSPGSTGKDTGNTVQVSYGSGSFSGEEYIDTVSFGGLTVKSQSVGAASESHGFNDGTDGILGVGPVGLTRNTVSNTESVPTFLDNLYSQGSISQEVLGVSFRPESGSDTNDANGELTLGGVDSSKFTGSLNYFSSPGPYWGVSVSSFTYGSKNLGAGNGIVDTGTTLIYIHTPAFNSFVSASGGKLDNENTGLVAYNTKPTSNFNIVISGKTYSLTPDQYLIPEAQYDNLEIPKGKYYAWIGDGGNSSVNTIIGQKFLEHYYSVYDTNNHRVGFAPNA